MCTNVKNFMNKIIIGIAIVFVAVDCLSGESYQSGNIKNITAVTKGVMIMMDSGVPDNCEGTPHGWLLIKQEHTAITSVVLAAWASGNKKGTVYTSGRENGNGYCTVNQYDPQN